MFHPRVNKKLTNIRIVFTTILLAVVSFNHAQNIDSIKAILSHYSENQEKLSVYQELVDQLIFSNPEEGILYGTLMFKLAKKLGDPQKAQKANRLIAVAYAQQGKYETAKTYFEKVLENSDKTNPSFIEKAKLFNNLGLIHAQLNDYPQALSYLNQSLTIKKEIGNEKGIAASLNNIGLNYYKMENFENALHFFLQALDIRKKRGVEKDIASSYINIGGIYYWLKNYDLALEYYNLAIDVFEGSKLVHKLSSAYEGKGEVFLIIGQYDSAAVYAQKALEIGIRIGNAPIQSKMWKLKGEIELKQGRENSAKNYLKKVLEINDSNLIAGNAFILLGDITKKRNIGQSERHYEKAAKLGEQKSSFSLRKEAYLKLSELYLEQNDFKKAY